ncbi:MAG TPA: gamma-glutamyltransferase, partial [Rectinemataceae bacterium]|nr:gamma-glutamyltransferase [Rectinemataceae bacterium]
MKKTGRRVAGAFGLSLAAAALLAGLALALLPKSPPEILEYRDVSGTRKPLLVAKDYAVVAGTPWAAQAARETLERGGNACDAAVAALLALNVTHGEAASFPGVAPTMYYNAARGEAKSYIGAGVAPAAATIEAFRKRGFKTVPEMDIWSQLVPASPDVVFALLKEGGTMSFGELAAPAIALARGGFPAHEVILENFSLSLLKRIGLSILLPYNSKVWLHGQWWRPMALHERLSFPELADSLASIAQAERKVLEAGGTREEGLKAARDYFYKGPIAERIAAFHRAKGGLMSLADLASYSGAWESPVSGSYGGYTIESNGAWSQGMVAPLALQILEGIDLKALGHNSPAYIHVVTQALELAMVDRDAYMGDPARVKVPVQALLSKAYAAQRRAAMTTRAFKPLPSPGRVEAPGARLLPAPSGEPEGDRFAGVGAIASLMYGPRARLGQDTSQIVVVDRAGNAVVMTPSDFPKTPMVPGTGLTLGNRMNQFRLDPASPNALEPGKRPRITPHAALVFRGGKLVLAFSTPGGDMQAQALVQVFLDMFVFGMDVESAVSAPRFYSVGVPSSFAPHESFPGTVRLEAQLHEKAAGGLAALGYTVLRDPDWDKDYGAVGAIMVGADGRLYAGSDPREET